ncbi:hypothetical protein DNTS_001793, partial [Danionella cerebrum]
MSSSHPLSHCLMESVGALVSPTGVITNLLSLPTPCPWDEDEESLGLEGIKPKLSPVPRRRSSASSDDSFSPLSSSRKVSFADAFGLSLVTVKQFDAWGATAPSGSLESDLNDDKEYYMTPLFTFPQTAENLSQRVYEQKLELESLEMLPGTTTIRGIIRVLNVCFDKMVYVRTSLDSWRSHFDLLAEYVIGSNSGEMDCFSFKLTLVPPFGEEGARVDFCLRCETSVGTFWANNSGENYSLCCCERIKKKPQNEGEIRRKSCLKAISTTFSEPSVTASNNEESPDTYSGKTTDPILLNHKTERLEKEAKELVEEVSRNRSQRSRRRAARLKKVKEHFAKREEETKQRTNIEEKDIKAEAGMQDQAPKQEKTPCSQPLKQTDSSSKKKQPPLIQSAEHLGEPMEIYSQALNPEKPEGTIINSDLSTEDENVELKQSAFSASEVDEDIKHTEELYTKRQSNSQPFHEGQNSEFMSINVEKAWEHFEKDAKLRVNCLPRSHKMKKEDQLCEEGVESKKSLLPPCGFTFGTIIAPLYHHVFKNMEAEKKDSVLRNSQEDLLFKDQEDGSLNAVTSTDIWPESRISIEPRAHGVSERPFEESTDRNSQETVNTTKYNPSDENRRTSVTVDGPQRQKHTDESLKSNEVKHPEVSPRKRKPPLKPCQSLCLFPTEDPKPLVTTDPNLPQKIHPSSNTPVLKSSVLLGNQTNCIGIEKPENQGSTKSQNQEENVSEYSATQFTNELNFEISPGLTEDNTVGTIDEMSFPSESMHTPKGSFQTSEECRSSQNDCVGEISLCAENVQKLEYVVNIQVKMDQEQNANLESAKKLEYNGGIYTIEHGLKYIDDEDDDLDERGPEGEKERGENLPFLERKEDKVISSFHCKTDPECNDEKNKTLDLGIFELLESEDREMFEETAKSWHKSQKCDFQHIGESQALQEEWDFSEFTSIEANLSNDTHNITYVTKSKMEYLVIDEEQVYEETAAFTRDAELSDINHVLENCKDYHEHNVENEANDSVFRDLHIEDDYKEEFNEVSFKSWQESSQKIVSELTGSTQALDVCETIEREGIDVSNKPEDEESWRMTTVVQDVKDYTEQTSEGTWEVTLGSSIYNM